MITVIAYYAFNLSAQGNCSVTAINPTNLTAVDKVFAIVYGTENVMIQCNCFDVNEKALSSIKWFDSNGIRLRFQRNHKYIAGDLHLMRTHNNSGVILVIPMFNNSYDGVYTCGIGRNFPPKEPNIDISLTFGK